VRLASRDVFADIDECIEDARRCGYLSSPVPLEAATS
jgi:hypothetical protein